MLRGVGDKTKIMALIIEELPVSRLISVSVAKGIIQCFRQIKINLYEYDLYVPNMWKKLTLNRQKAILDLKAGSL